jgi:hypothetical protein
MVMVFLLLPFGLSLSKARTGSGWAVEEERPFDKLRANGFQRSIFKRGGPETGTVS